MSSQPAGSLIVVCFIEPTSVGEVFARSRWPVHMTVMPWFTVDAHTADEKLTETLQQVPAFDAPIGAQKGFGRGGRTIVNLITPKAGAQRLHDAVYAALQSFRATLTTRHIGGDYSPHITRYGDRSPNTSEVIRISNCSLVRLEEDTRHCKVIAEYQLAGDTHA